MLVPDQQEPEELIIDDAPPAELEREARMTPAQAVEQMRIRVPARTARLGAVLERVNADTELKALWHVSNVNAIARLQINDHSWCIQIVANIALKLLRQLTSARRRVDVDDYGLEPDDAEVALLLERCCTTRACPCTATTTRTSSLFLAARKARGCSSRATTSRSGPWWSRGAARDHEPRASRPLTLEAGVLRVADALDMAKGRSRIPFAAGQVSMRSLSAAAVDKVSILDDEEKPVLIEITMNNSSGIYQVDGLLKAARLRPGAVRRGGRAHRHRGRDAPRAHLPARDVKRLRG